MKGSPLGVGSDIGGSIRLHLSLGFWFRSLRFSDVVAGKISQVFRVSLDYLLDEGRTTG
jgi:hypothetical protein